MGPMTGRRMGNCGPAAAGRDRTLAEAAMDLSTDDNFGAADGRLAGNGLGRGRGIGAGRGRRFAGSGNGRGRGMGFGRRGAVR